MARERGLLGLSNQRQPGGTKARGADRNRVCPPRSRQAVYFGRAEREIMRSGGYSWVGDVRARVALAKTMARSEVEFLGILDALDVHVADNSPKARRDDWIFSLADDPTKRVSGERLGFTYGKQMLQRRFTRIGAYRPTERSVEAIRAHAEHAVEINDLRDLSRLSAALETCAKFDVESLEKFDRRLETLKRRGQAESEGFRRLTEAKEYMGGRGLMPKQVLYRRDDGAHARSGRDTHADMARKGRQARERNGERGMER